MSTRGFATHTEETHVEPHGGGSLPLGIHRFDRSHVVVERGHGVVGRVDAVVALHQNGRVRVDAEEVGGASDPLDLLLGELWQSRPREALLLAQVVDAVDHHLGVVACLREDWVCKPTELEEERMG